VSGRGLYTFRDQQGLEVDFVVPGVKAMPWTDFVTGAMGASSGARRGVQARAPADLGGNLRELSLETPWDYR
jgi:hypothetical protein